MLKNLHGVVATETKFETKPCEICKLRLHFTQVEDCTGYVWTVCKYCLPAKQKTCFFCSRQCFFTDQCRKCRQTFRNIKEKQKVYAHEDIYCFCCKKFLTRTKKRTTTQILHYTDLNGNKLCDKCKPFETQRSICFTCRKHFNSSSALHKHLRSVPDHQLSKEIVNSQWEVLEQRK